MTSDQLDNYLRMHRHRQALSQDEVAFLVGAGSAGTIARYELGQRDPSLETALALQALYGVPVAELFAGRFNTVEQSVARRANERIAMIRAGGISPAATVKLKHLSDVIRRSGLEL